jgi:hypothetical protein
LRWAGLAYWRWRFGGRWNGAPIEAGLMPDDCSMQCWVRRAGLRWKYHTTMWLSWRWKQIDEGFAVVDDFGDLVTVER